MRKLALLFVLGIVLLASPATHAQKQENSTLSLFTPKIAAQQHCPKDTVVWLNTQSGVTHFKKQRWYDTTNNGAYVCRREADTSGDRATRNGQ